MRKLWAFFRIEINKTLMYRLETLIWFILEFSGIIPVIFLWLYLGSTGRLDVNNVNYLVVYYILTVIIGRLTNSQFEHEEVDEIKDGNVSPVFLKPIDYAAMLFARETASRASGLVYLLPTLAIVLLFVKQMFLTSLHFEALIPVILILVISFLQKLWVSWLITLAAFWIDQAKSLLHLKWMLEGILGGQWLPLIFFPLWVQNIAKFLPFYYWYNFPIDLMVGRIQLRDNLDKLAISVIWLGILWFLGRVLWKQAIKKYSAVGN